MGFYKLQYTHEWYEELIEKRSVPLLNNVLETLSNFTIVSIEPSTAKTAGTIILEREDDKDNVIEEPITIEFIYSSDNPNEFIVKFG